MEELKEELKQTGTGDTRLSKEEMKEKIKDIKENHLQIETTEVKKRGRKKYEDMTEEEKQEYDRKKELKEMEKLELERLKNLGVNPATGKEISNSVSIVLTDEFIKKCKKEKIGEEYFSDIINTLIRKFANDEIELKKETRTVFF